jgi:hypothetical protein
MTLSIVDFLNARLAEDEAVAQAAIDPDRPGANWEWIDPDDDTAADFEDGSLVVGSLRTVEDFPTRSGVGDLPAFIIHTAEDVMEGAAVHIVRHDPARVLREVEAKRAVIAEHATMTAIWWPDVEAIEVECCERCSNDEHEVAVEAPCPTLLALAAVYQDHPDWREEWRPTS